MRYTDAEVEHLDHRTNPEFRAKATKVAAALHSNRVGAEVEPRDIDSRDLAEHLKARRLRRLALVLLTLLTIAAVVAAVVADQQRRAAERLAAEATSRALAANSLSVVDAQPDLAALLALESTRGTEHTAESRRALLAAVASPWRATLPLEYTGSVAVFSHDGGRLAITDDSQPPVWDLEADAQRLDFGTEGWGDVTTLSFNDDSSLLAAGGPSGAVVRNVEGAATAVLSTDSVHSVEFSRDGSLIVAARPTGATVWDVSGRVVAQIDAGDITGAVFDPDATRVLTIGRAGFTIWDLDGTALVELVGADPNDAGDDIPVSAAFSSDGRLVATAADERVVLWSDTGDRLAEFSTGSPQFDESGELVNRVSTVAFDPRGHHLVSSGPDGTVVWAIADGSRVELPTGPTIWAAYSRDGTRIVTIDASVADGSPEPSACPPDLCIGDGDPVPNDGGGFGGSTDGSTAGGALQIETDPVEAVRPRHRVRLWMLGADDVARLAPAPGEPVYESAAFSTDGTRLVTTTRAGAQVWDLDGNRIATVADGDTVTAVLDRDGSRVFTLTGVGPFTLSSIDLADGGRRSVLTDEASGPPVVDDEGARLAVATGAGIVTWDLAAARTPVEIDRVPIPAQERIAFDRDWTRLVTGIDPSRGFPTDEPTGPQLFDGDGEYLTIIEVRSSWETLNSDGSQLATVSDEGVTLWNVPNLDERVLLTTQEMGSVGFDPDGTRVVTANDDGVTIWDVTGDMLSVLTPDRATHAEFSRDGAFVVATLSDQVRVWRVPNDTELRAQLEHRLGYRGVSYDELRANQGQTVRGVDGWKFSFFTSSECSLYQIDRCSLEFAD
jgi:WD40 repeat protein